MLSTQISTVIGRFQIFHQDHKELIKESFNHGSKTIVVIGSIDQARTPKNPFNYEERKQMILSAFNEADKKRLIFIGVRDFYYWKTRWTTTVANQINQELNKLNLNPQTTKVNLIGFKKDKETAEYLNSFGQSNWNFINIRKDKEESKLLSATYLRELFFEEKMSQLKAHLDPNVFKFLSNFIINQKEIFKNVKDEYNFYKTEKRGYMPHEVTKDGETYIVSEYFPIRVTVDAVVIQSGHVLLVERGYLPGKGLYALPGGHLESENEIFEDAVRELKEETKLKVSETILQNCLKEVKEFSHPKRSLRGRVITFAHLFKLNDSFSLPEVRGSSDAKKAFWMPINEALKHPELFFEDHYFILEYFINRF